MTNNIIEQSGLFGSLNPPPIDAATYPAQQNLTTSSNFSTGSAKTMSLNSQPVNSLPTPIVPEEANGNLPLTQHGYPAQQKLTTLSNFANESLKLVLAIYNTDTQHGYPAQQKLTTLSNFANESLKLVLAIYPQYQIKCLCSSTPISNWKPSAI